MNNSMMSQLGSIGANSAPFSGGGLKEGYTNYAKIVDYSQLGNHVGKGIPFSWANLKLKPGKSDWKHEPSDPGLIPYDEPLIPPALGATGYPLKDYYTTPPPPEERLFVFARNKSSPACCPSTFSTSGACVCTTKDQRDWIGQGRGGNKAPYDFKKHQFDAKYDDYPYM